MTQSTSSLDILAKAEDAFLDGIVNLAESSIAKPKLPRANVEFGVPMDLPFGGFTAEEILNPSELTVNQLVEMLRIDGQARCLMRVLTLPIRSAGFTIMPAEGGDEEAEFIDKNFNLPPHNGGMTSSFNKFLRSLLLAIAQGFSAFNIVYDFAETGPLEGKLIIRKLSHRPANTITFLVDDHGGFKGMRQRTTFLGRSFDVEIKPPYAFYWAANEEENPFYGLSYFHPAYYHWDKKRKLYYLMHLAAQFNAVPGRFGNYPAAANQQDIAKFRSALENFGLNTSITAPEGYELHELKGESKFEYIKAIDHHNAMMSKSVMAQFVDLGQQEGKGSSYALSQDQSDLFIMAIEAIMLEIEEQITHHLIPGLINWNFGSENYPTFKFNPLTDATKDILRDVFKTVAAAPNLSVTPEFLFAMEKRMAERLGFDLDYEKIEADFLEMRKMEIENEKAILNDPAPTPGEEAKKAEEQAKQAAQQPKPPTDASDRRATYEELVDLVEEYLREEPSEDD